MVVDKLDFTEINNYFKCLLSELSKNHQQPKALAKDLSGAPSMSMSSVLYNITYNLTDIEHRQQ